MGELINISQGNIITALHKGEISLDMPFKKEIYLTNAEVVGVVYCDDIWEISETLAIDTKVVLIREPQNHYDKYAIAVYSSDNRKIGYIPRDKNHIFARLMDAGKYLFGKITENIPPDFDVLDRPSKEEMNNQRYKYNDFKIRISIFMED